MDKPPAGCRIATITPQERRPQRVTVVLEDGTALGLDAALLREAGLQVGDPLPPEQLAQLRAADEVARATDAALRRLALRPRSERELRDRLREKGYPPGAIEAALAKLAGWRYVDDADFARYWVENRTAHQPRGARRLEQELRHKGVERETIRAAIAAAELDEAAAALALAQSKLRAYAGLEPAVQRRRLAGFLGRRGYGYDVVRRVLEQLFGEEATADEPAAPPPEP